MRDRWRSYSKVTAIALLALAIPRPAPASSQVDADKPRQLVDLHDYPPYFDALSAELRKAGLGGSETIPGISVLDEGIRVMPVKLAVGGSLTQLADLVSGLTGPGFPYATVVGELTLGATPSRDRPFRIELMLLAPVRPEGEASPDLDLRARLDADTRRSALVTNLLSQVVAAQRRDPWLRVIRLDGGEVSLEGTIPKGRTSGEVFQTVLGLDGMVIGEIVGPHDDPRDGAAVFMATGRLAGPVTAEKAGPGGTR